MDLISNGLVEICSLVNALLFELQLTFIAQLISAVLPPERVAQWVHQ